MSSGRPSMLQNQLFAVRLSVRAAAAADLSLSLGVAAFAGLGAVVAVLVPVSARELVDSATSGSTSGIAWGVGLIAANAVLLLVLGWLNTTLATTLEERTDHWLELQLSRMAADTADLGPAEDPDYQDHLHILLNMRGALGGTITALVSAASLVVRYAVAAVLLAAVSPVLVVIPTVMFVLPLLASAKSESILGSSITAVAERNRMATAIFQTTTAGSSGPELRAYRLGPELARRHASLLTDVDGEQLRARLRATGIDALAWLVYGVAIACALLIVVTTHGLGAGDITLILLMTTQLAGQVQSAATVVSEFVRQAELCWHFRELQDRATPQDRGVTPNDVTGPMRTLRFSGVGFTYPGGLRPALDGIDLELRAGSVVALVGANGAGKSTFVNLLLRYHLPTSGRITVGDVDLADIDVRSWRDGSATGFQDFCRFELPAGQVVGVGDLPRRDDGAAVTVALERARTDSVIEALPDGYATPLGRTLAGTDLSTGQWQKLALGRTMMRDRPRLMILDEPTASLDAEAERDLFRAYLKRARALAEENGCITLLVTHRFPSAREADRIVVFEEGRIAEVGSHTQLVAAGGYYADLYEQQSRDYR